MARWSSPLIPDICISSELSLPYCTRPRDPPSPRPLTSRKFDLRPRRFSLLDRVFLVLRLGRPTARHRQFSLRFRIPQGPSKLGSPVPGWRPPPAAVLSLY